MRGSCSGHKLLVRCAFREFQYSKRRSRRAPANDAKLFGFSFFDRSQIPEKQFRFFRHNRCAGLVLVISCSYDARFGSSSTPNVGLVELQATTLKCSVSGFSTVCMQIPEKQFRFFRHNRCARLVLVITCSYDARFGSSSTPIVGLVELHATTLKCLVSGFSPARRFEKNSSGFFDMTGGQILFSP